LYAPSKTLLSAGSQPFRFSAIPTIRLFEPEIELGGKRSRRLAFASKNVVSVDPVRGRDEQLLARVATAIGWPPATDALDQLYKREVNTLESIVDYIVRRVKRARPPKPT